MLPKRRPGCLIIRYPGRKKGNWEQKTAGSLGLGFGCWVEGDFCKGLLAQFPAPRPAFETVPYIGLLAKIQTGVESKKPGGNPNRPQEAGGSAETFGFRQPGHPYPACAAANRSLPFRHFPFCRKSVARTAAPPVLQAQTRNRAGGLGRRSRYALRINV